jgi:hypothetical protein
MLRMALRDDIRDPGASRKWEARIAELEGDVIHTTEEIIALLADIHRAKGEIAKIVDAERARR